MLQESQDQKRVRQHRVREGHDRRGSLLGRLRDAICSTDRRYEQVARVVIETVRWLEAACDEGSREAQHNCLNVFLRLYIDGQRPIYIALETVILASKPLSPKHCAGQELRCHEVSRTRAVEICRTSDLHQPRRREFCAKLGA